MSQPAGRPISALRRWVGIVMTLSVVAALLGLTAGVVGATTTSVEALRDGYDAVPASRVEHADGGRRTDPADTTSPRPCLDPRSIGLVAATRQQIATNSELPALGAGDVPIGELGPGVRGNPAWINASELPAAEQSALDTTLGYIDSGATPSGPLATKWGTRFGNWGEDLPGGVGAGSPYLEYRVAAPPGVSGVGPLRVVVDTQSRNPGPPTTPGPTTGRPGRPRS